MMLAFMISALLVSAGVAVTAAAAERAAIPVRIQGLRWIWAAAMLGAAVVPSIRMSQTRQAPPIPVRQSFAPTASQNDHLIAFPALRRTVTHSREIVVHALSMRVARRTGRVAGTAWLLVSGALGLSLLASYFRLRADAKRWESVTLEATPVT